MQYYKEKKEVPQQQELSKVIDHSRTSNKQTRIQIILHVMIQDLRKQKTKTWFNRC